MYLTPIIEQLFTAKWCQNIPLHNSRWYQGYYSWNWKQHFMIFLWCPNQNTHYSFWQKLGHVLSKRTLKDQTTNLMLVHFVVLVIYIDLSLRELMWLKSNHFFNNYLLKQQLPGHHQEHHFSSLVLATTRHTYHGTTSGNDRLTLALKGVRILP